MQSLVAVDFNEVFDWNFHLRHIIEIAQEEMLVFNSARLLKKSCVPLQKINSLVIGRISKNPVRI